MKEVKMYYVRENNYWRKEDSPGGEYLERIYADKNKALEVYNGIDLEEDYNVRVEADNEKTYLCKDFIVAIAEFDDDEEIEAEYDLMACPRPNIYYHFNFDDDESENLCEFYYGNEDE